MLFLHFQIIESRTLQLRWLQQLCSLALSLSLIKGYVPAALLLSEISQ